jgi:lipopolysaccharide transport system permease protein
MEQRSSSTPTQLEVRRYTPELALRHPWKLLSGLLEDIYRGRELAWRLFVRDFQAQFRQTYLGYLWAFLPPLFTSLTFIFLQSQGIVNIQGVGKSYAAFAMIGTLLWQTFAEAIQAPLQSILNAKPMLAKINFPREAILVAGLYGVLLNLLIRLLLIGGVLLVWKIVPGVGLLTLPIWIVGLVFLGFALGLALLPLGGLYGDVLKSLPILLQFWMLLTPVVYPARTEGWLGWLCSWNPVAPLISLARASLTGDSLLPQGALGILATLFSLFLCLMGLIGYRIVMPRIIERIGG